MNLFKNILKSFIWDLAFLDRFKAQIFFYKTKLIIFQALNTDKGFLFNLRLFFFFLLKAWNNFKKHDIAMNFVIY